MQKHTLTKTLVIALFLCLVSALQASAYEANFVAGNRRDAGNAYGDYEELMAADEDVADEDAASVIAEAGTDIKGESSDFVSYLNDGEFDGKDDGLKIADLAPDTRVVVGGDSGAGLSLKVDYENAPFVE